MKNEKDTINDLINELEATTDNFELLNICINSASKAMKGINKFNKKTKFAHGDDIYKIGECLVATQVGLMTFYKRYEKFEKEYKNKKITIEDK